MPYTKEQACQKISELVASFKASEARLHREAEAQIENNFIRPLFQYLNWNTRNAGLAVADYEFLVQKTHRYGKRPDYILQLDRQHLLVMDAKQVKYDLHDPRWMNQVYAYAYSTQNLAPARRIDFAVLTDFQEFIVLDCTLYAGDPRAVSNFRVLDWRCEDYLEQFDTLWELFERENLRQAARSRAAGQPAGLWARALSPRKVKANRLPPDKTFLAEMDDDKTGWRVRLAKDMKKHNPEAGGALITAAVQLLIDRLIFVKALSDREIEQDYLAKLAETVERDGLSESATGWFRACRAIFEKLNDFYNGSIFERRPELEAVAVSNKVVREIIRALQPENSPYNFAALPVEILGTIYERFLGRVVRSTDKRVYIEDKPEVRKAGGVYYTPQYIVDYIVRNSVGKLLEGCRAPEEVAKLRILDPACGSGSFLLGAYAALLDWHLAYYRAKSRPGKQDRAAAYRDPDGQVRLTARLKRQILLNNLFGVDIDPQAVEVTRFSLSLKALEDTRREELDEERSLFRQSVLPDLSRNIRCGNSLIAPDYFSGMFPDAQEMLRVNPFDWQGAFPQVFSESGGFDAVIGNPPYIRIQTLQESGPGQVAYLKRSYRAAASGNYDIYVVFVEKGLGLLNERGRLGYILPHKFFNAKYGEGLRSLIAGGRHLTGVVHFGDRQVFEGATTYTALLFLDKTGRDSFEFVRVLDLQAWREGEPQERGEIKTEAVTAAEWNFTVGKGAELFEKLSQMPVKLQDISTRIYQGPITSADDVFLFKKYQNESLDVIDVFSKELDEWVKLERSILKRVVRSGSIGRYWAITTAYVLFPYSIDGHTAKLFSKNEMQKMYPLAWAYLERNKKVLESREKGAFRDSEWYRFGRTQNLAMWEQPKLLVPYMITELSAYPDRIDNFYFINVTTGGYGITLNESHGNYLYICGLLNSHLLDFYLKKVSTTFHSGYFAANKQYVERLPIRTINFSDPADKARHDQLTQLVESMLALHRHKAAAPTQSEQELFQRQIEATDRQIDALVYRLYGLGEAEIAIVEESLKRP
ncbi:MAG: Eco57I restriction-modification methylase domain-containing protein [Calditrichaceae bacterium]|nr:Eco57I restriction-modification methylase domain-containing protein [Calditrichia bacterium]NUQ42137.1 Eco57I restriction-modification methylase domain-containing protein [Calditrichaceae bacterium]